MKSVVVARYASVIASLNARIQEFNAFLAPSKSFDIIAPGNPTTYSDTLENEWGKQGWPSKDLPGVYAFCCRLESDDSKLALYIGKASMREMGHRMYQHLRPHRDSGIYRRQFQDQSYVVDAMLATPVSEKGAGCLASALEEFLIAGGVPGVPLMNSIGLRST